jgi:hypothetical protein
VFHCSAAAEGHCTSDAIEVMDLWNRRTASPTPDLAPDHDVVRIQNLRWSTPSKVEYKGSVQLFKPEPQPERPMEGSINVGSLQFH